VRPVRVEAYPEPQSGEFVVDAPSQPHRPVVPVYFRVDGHADEGAGHGRNASRDRSESDLFSLWVGEQRSYLRPKRNTDSHSAQVENLCVSINPPRREREQYPISRAS